MAQTFEANDENKNDTDVYPLGFSFKGGFLGVDIFFVISGYLISKLLTETKKDENWLLIFLNKRLRRILPALYITIFCVTVISFVEFTPIHLDRVSSARQSN